MIHCEACSKATDGLDGLCSDCYPVLHKPLTEAEQFLVDLVHESENRISMAWIQRQADRQMVKHAGCGLPGCGP